MIEKQFKQLYDLRQNNIGFRFGYHTARIRTLPDTRICLYCKQVEFIPRSIGNIFCSRSCASKARVRNYKIKDPVLFAKMYNSSCLESEITTMFGIVKTTIQRWRRKLGLPPRLSGNRKQIKA